MVAGSLIESPRLVDLERDSDLDGGTSAGGGPEGIGGEVVGGGSKEEPAGAGSGDSGDTSYQ
jgi:hypothetical protein